jgi:hypothetical protein
MKRTVLACLLLILLSALSGFSADLTGKWTGTAEFVGEDGQPLSRGVIFILKQEGTAISGEAGYDESMVAPISNGKFDGKKFTMTVSADIEYKIEMNLVSENRLEGVAKFTPPNAPELSAKLVLNKTQQK